MRVFAALAGLVLKVRICDTQCGAKLIDLALAQQLFEAPFITSWVFDVELFARLESFAGAEAATGLLRESPLQSWHDMHGSKLRPHNFLLAPFSLLAIWFAHRKMLRKK